jgi:hypothetical protein
MDDGGPRAPQERIAAECASGGRAALIDGCVALLDGRPDDVDDRLITLLGGNAAGHVLDGGEGGRSGYWPRVWAARGLLHAWDDRTAEADGDAGADAATAGDGRAAEAYAGTAGADRPAEADRPVEVDAVTAAIIGALGDRAWRVREMAAKVVAAHRVGQALDAVAAIRDDPVPRVRVAAERAVVLLTAAQA